MLRNLIFSGVLLLTPLALAACGGGEEAPPSEAQNENATLQNASSQVLVNATHSANASLETPTTSPLQVEWPFDRRTLPKGGFDRSEVKNGAKHFYVNDYSFDDFVAYVSDLEAAGYQSSINSDYVTLRDLKAQSIDSPPASTITWQLEKGSDTNTSYEAIVVTWFKPGFVYPHGEAIDYSLYVMPVENKE